MTDARAFGLELQRARERRGLTLDQLAEATKVSASLYAGLENGDVTRWPAGIFRRAFVRSYAQAVGLDPEDTLARFLSRHPDPEVLAASPGSATILLEPPVDGAVVAPIRPDLPRRLAAPLLDLILAGIPALAVSLAFGWRWFFPVAAGIGLVGHFLALALFGVTPGVGLILRRSPRASGPAVLEPDNQVRRRTEGEAATSTPRRHQPRHPSGPRSVAGPRARRVQH